MSFDELGINEQFTTPLTGNKVFRKIARTAEECFALDEYDGFFTTVSKFREVKIYAPSAILIRSKFDIFKDQEPPQMIAGIKEKFKS